MTLEALLLVIGGLGLLGWGGSRWLRPRLQARQPFPPGTAVYWREAPHTDDWDPRRREGEAIVLTHQASRRSHPHSYDIQLRRTGERLRVPRHELRRQDRTTAE